MDISTLYIIWFGYPPEIIVLLFYSRSVTIVFTKNIIFDKSELYKTNLNNLVKHCFRYINDIKRMTAAFEAIENIMKLFQ